MHFSKRRGSQESLLTASPSSTLAAVAERPTTTLASSSSSPSTMSSSSSPSTPLMSYSPKTPNGLRLGLWCFILATVVLIAQQQPCECRYLPTRSHGDDLDKLRELMLQILEASNEDQRPPNEANGNTLAAGQRANWLSKLGGMDGMDAPRKYAAPHGVYDNGRYY